MSIKLFTKFFATAGLGVAVFVGNAEASPIIYDFEEQTPNSQVDSVIYADGTTFDNALARPMLIANFYGDFNNILSVGNSTDSISIFNEYDLSFMLGELNAYNVAPYGVDNNVTFTYTLEDGSTDVLTYDLIDIANTPVTISAYGSYVTNVLIETNNAILGLDNVSVTTKEVDDNTMDVSATGSFAFFLAGLAGIGYSRRETLPKSKYALK